MAHRLSQATRRPAFAVDYRLAPTHPYPAAINDVVAAYRAILAHGVPASRILLVGESAGGTLLLSALLVLAGADDPLPAGAIPISAVTDFVTEDPAPITANRGSDVIDPTTVAAVGAGYLGSARRDEAPQSPIYGDLSRMPPLLVIVGGDEILLGDSRRFAEAASAAGAAVDLDIYEGMPHAFHAGALLPEDRAPHTATTFLSRLTDWVGRLPDQYGTPQ